ncbi:MAG TPA: hypothetical protein VL241_11520 [Gemmatimonadales bacterium]|nr:hypothetical protein [Gemmatimonadales bacterium]
MRHLLIFLHLLGLVLWLGGGIAAMHVGIAMRRAVRAELTTLVAVQVRLLRAQILPGSLLVVLTGILLTLRLYGSATATAGYPTGLMVMQGAGLLGAVVVLVVMLPTVSRIARLDPQGPQAPLFDALRNKAALGGMVAGLLGLAALIGGALLR